MFANDFVFIVMAGVTSFSTGWYATHMIFAVVGVILAVADGLMIRQDPNVQNSGPLGLFVRKPLSRRTSVAQVFLVQPGATMLVSSLSLFSQQNIISLVFLIVSVVMLLSGYILAATDKPKSPHAPRDGR